MIICRFEKSQSVHSAKSKCGSVRSDKARSLSSKYSEKNFDETRRYLRKNESLCIAPHKDKAVIRQHAHLYGRTFYSG